jgi:uncharacterized membrane protein
MDSVYYLVFLRSIHIITGVFWAGAAMYLGWFVIPAAKAAGPEGGKFMQQLGQTNRLPIVMNTASMLCILSGILLLWELSAGFNTEWLSTRHGIILLTGSLFTLLAFLEGFLIIRPNVEKMNHISKSVAMAGGPPSSEQIQQLMIIRNKIAAASRIGAILLLAAVIGMSLLRYL